MTTEDKYLAKARKIVNHCLYTPIDMDHPSEHFSQRLLRHITSALREAATPVELSEKQIAEWAEKQRSGPNNVCDCAVSFTAGFRKAMSLNAVAKPTQPDHIGMDIDHETKKAITS